jgi:ribosomal protein S18 acetylase RimI-like enzyme
MQTADFNIRLATPADASALAALLARVFAATYGAVIPAATLKTYQARVFAPGAVAAQLGHADTLPLLAIDGGALIGASILAPGAPEGHQLPAAVELSRLYVDTSWQGRGVGRALLEHTFDLARAHGYQTIWLCVWEHNEAARAFYPAHGFTTFGRAPVWVDSIRFDDLLMQRTLYD